MVCAASAVVGELQTQAKALGFEDGSYATFHLRRNDFHDQYKSVIQTAEQIYETTKDKLRENELIFFATDERDKSYFDFFVQKGHTIRFLGDFGEVHLDTDFLGMVDSLVAASGRVFFGTYFSTFSGYITRLRGYLLKNDKTTYYTTKTHFNENQQWTVGGFWGREYPAGWYLIDSDELQEKYIVKKPEEEFPQLARD